MLAAAHRLRRSGDFAAAIRGGRRASRGAVVVHLTIPQLTDSDQPVAERRGKPVRTQGAEAVTVRAGFVVSRAVGGAVTRNKVRRRLRDLVAERLDALPIGSDLVVRALPAAATTPYPRMAADLDAALAAARAPRPPRGPRRRP